MNKVNIGDLIKIVNADPDELYKNGEIYRIHDKSYIEGRVYIYMDIIDDICIVEEHEYEKVEENKILGVSKDSEVVENENGAKQSKSFYRMDLIDANALLKIAQVHAEGGAKYGDTNWHGIPINDHINHALVHIYADLAGDKQDEHLAHAATRLIFALALQLDPNKGA